MALTDNLLAWYKCDEASGNLVDALGGTNLTDNDTVGATTGLISGGRSFNGSSEFFSRSGNFGGGAASGDPFSVAFVYQIPATGSNRQILGRYDGTKLFQIGVNVSTLHAIYGVSPFNILSGGTVSTSTWYGVVFTYSTTGAGTLYINGSSVATGGALTGAFDAATDLNVGRRGGDGTEYSNATIDLLGFWNRELTSGEASSLWNSGAGFDHPFGAAGQPAIKRLAGTKYAGRQLPSGIYVW